ncbi:hypothetical protein [Herbiconiux liangxiaofengii]|uniref:hypothetical protein n=1 Tax=Herbiconiux liangxiaofengii TaxID=3342795 RepID=UPI0035B92EF5
MAPAAIDRKALPLNNPSSTVALLGVIILLFLIAAPGAPAAMYIIGGVLFLAGMLGLTLRPTPSRPAATPDRAPDA